MLRSTGLPRAWRYVEKIPSKLIFSRELVQMLHLNRKAEIEILCTIPRQEQQKILADGLPEDSQLSQRSVVGGIRRNALVEYVVERIVASAAPST